jgi:hypothetical protein
VRGAASSARGGERLPAPGVERGPCCVMTTTRWTAALGGGGGPARSGRGRAVPPPVRPPPCASSRARTSRTRAGAGRRTTRAGPRPSGRSTRPAQCRSRPRRRAASCARSRGSARSPATRPSRTRSPTRGRSRSSCPGPLMGITLQTTGGLPIPTPPSSPGRLQGGPLGLCRHWAGGGGRSRGWLEHQMIALYILKRQPSEWLGTTYAKAARSCENSARVPSHSSRSSRRS